MILTIDVADKVKGFTKYLDDKRKKRGNGGLLLNYAGDLIAQAMVEVLISFFASVITSKTSLQKFHVPETNSIIWSKEEVPLVGDDHVKAYLSKVDTYRFIGLDRMHTQVLKEMAGIISRPFSIVFESEQFRETLEDWKKTKSLLSLRMARQMTYGGSAWSASP